jgi:MFS family permease
MCNTEQTFAWVGAIVVNIAFISIIAWGASTIWWVGFLISIVYTAILFGLARTVDKKSGWDVVAGAAGAATSTNGNDSNMNVLEENSDEGSVEHNATHNVVVAVAADPSVATAPRRRGVLRMLPRSTTTTSSEPRMPVLANFLYGLFTLALGVTGYFLPMNLFSCYGGSSGPYTPSTGQWSTDISTLPSDVVRDWASSTQPHESHATFAYISSAGGERNSTLFQGSDASGSHPQTLWLAMGREPINFPNIQNPSQFITTETGWACFAGIDAMPSSNSNQIPMSKGSLVGCSNGTVVRTTDLTQYTFQGPYDFIIDNTTLWFKDYPPWSGDQSGSGTLIYSIDNYDRMEVQLHSTYTKSKSKQYTPVEYSSSYEDVATNDDDNKCWTNHSVLAIFVSALPTTLASVLLWLKRKAPSSAITSYIGLSAGSSFLYLAIVGNEYGVDTFWRWWFSISGALYLAILCDLTHCKRRIARYPLIWGINVSALAFFIGMIILTGIFEVNMAWSWIVFNVFALIPLVVVGIGYNQLFLLVLCAVGWLMTTVKIASALAAVAAPAANVPIYFVTLAISGLIIAGAGWWLNKKQDELGSVLCYYMERISVSRRMFPDVVRDSNDDLRGETSA